MIPRQLRSLIILYGQPITILRRILQRLAHFSFRALHFVGGFQRFRGRIFLFAPRISEQDRESLLRRLKFYCPDSLDFKVAEVRTVPLFLWFSPEPLLQSGQHSTLLNSMLSIRPGTFCVDFRTNALDGWEWTRLAAYIDPRRVDLDSSRQRFASRVARLRQQGKEKTYIFGTGPSLANALDKQWEDGYRIVCNTIVRDRFLWDHLKPDFIVAGDAIYHFGFTSFARAFRRDLRKCLVSSDTLFLYPAEFHSIVRREFDGLNDRLIPVPKGWLRKIDIDLVKHFQLPGLGNVLGLLLLPLACTLSKDVFLFGFDGRAPNDKLFWGNSPKHSYQEHLAELQEAHPYFFEFFVPEYNLNKYVKNVHGEQLDICLSMAESRGWRFVMMHRSWTPTLQRRFQGDD